MAQLQRTSPLAVAASAIVGVAVGLLTQFVRSTWGYAPFSPPISLSATLLVLAVVLLVLGLLLRRAMRAGSKKPVDPFHAVRLLAGAKAGALGGALFAGFGLGLALQLLTRSVPASFEIWLPILLVFGCGILLVVVALIVERFCRIPPAGRDSETPDGEVHREGEPETGHGLAADAQNPGRSTP